MGRLSGFSYRSIIKRLRQFGFAFDRQAAGSHEIWYNPETRLSDNGSESPGRYAGRDIAGDPEAGRH